MAPRYKYERSICMEHQSLWALHHRITAILNMKLFVFVCLLATCYADLLAFGQRAPSHAYSSGGNDFLNTPAQSYHAPSNQYLPPGYPPASSPKPVYLPPSTTKRPPNTYLPPSKPTNNYLPPSKPTNAYLPPSQPTNTYLPPSKPGNTYLPPSGHGPTTPPVPILHQENELNADGSFKFGFVSGDHTQVEQMGHIENPGTDHEEQVMHGSYSYIGDDGKEYKVIYVADSNGFRAQGDHLPTPPPIPEAIQKALDLIASQQSQGNQGYPSGRPDQTYLPPQPTQKPGYYY